MSNNNIIRNLGGATAGTPFTLATQQEADGESVRTTFVSFDSLGTELVLDLTIVLEEKSNAGTQWRFYVESEDDSDLSRVLGNGTISFDTNGQLISTTDATVTIDRDDTGAQTPQGIEINFNDPQRAISALTDTTSQVAAISQDGFPIGTLDDFSINTDGVVTGVFSNGLLRNLGQVVLATFTNPEGLREVAGSLFEATASSGGGALSAPGKGGAGRIIGGALELSNVDLSQEFITLITASTGFSANSRVLTTSDRLMQELISVVR
jgi:flagellar hook protein FlgE